MTPTPPTPTTTTPAAHLARPSPAPVTWKTGFARRLCYYLIGIALGLVMLAMLRMARNASTTSAPVPPTKSAPSP